MKRNVSEPRVYKHENLMTDINNLQIRIKTHLFDLGDDEFKEKHPIPTVQELDELMGRIMVALREDSTPAIKR